MDWIFDHFQILAIVGLAFASWLKSLADAKAAKREEEEARRELEEVEDVFGSPEDWGRPAPPPAPVSQPPLVRVPPPPPVPVAEVQGEMKRQMDLQEKLRQLRETRKTTTRGTDDVRSRTRREKAVQTTVPAGLAGALRDQSEVRRAIVMREILGPPLGLR